VSLFSALHYFVHVPKRATFCPATFNLFCHLTLVAISVVTLNCLSVTRRLADIYCWCSASWSLNKGRLSPETQHAVASNEYAMLILGRKKPHPVSVCSMRYLQWVATSLILYLCVPCGIYSGSQQASPCICVFHAVFTVGRKKPQHCLAFAENHDVSDVGPVDVIR